MSFMPFIIAAFLYSQTNTVVSGLHAAPEEGDVQNHVGSWCGLSPRTWQYLCGIIVPEQCGRFQACIPGPQTSVSISPFWQRLKACSGKAWDELNAAISATTFFPTGFELCWGSKLPSSWGSQLWRTAWRSSSFSACFYLCIYAHFHPILGKSWGVFVINWERVRLCTDAEREGSTVRLKDSQ